MLRFGRLGNLMNCSVEKKRRMRDGLDERKDGDVDWYETFVRLGWILSVFDFVIHLMT
jgi:hypothetical protein